MAEQPDVDQDREQMPHSGHGPRPFSPQGEVAADNAQASAGPATQQPAASEYPSAAGNSLETSAGSHPQPAPHATGNPAGSEGREPRPSHTASDHGTDLQTAPAAPALAQSGPLPAAGDDSSNPGNSAEQAAIRLTAGQLFGAIGLGIAIALVGIGGFLLGLMHVFRQDERVRLEIDPAALDLGEVWAQSGFVCELPVRNTGTRPVTVLDVHTSGCLCTSVTPRQFVVPPGQTRKLSLTLDMAAGDAVGAPYWEEVLKVRVSFRYGGTSATVHWWELSGRMRRAFLARPNVLDFEGAGRVVRGAPAPVKGFDLELADGVAGISLEELTDVRAWAVRNKGRWRIDVQPNSDMPSGPFRAELRVRARLHNGQYLPPYALQVRGTCVEDLEFVPSLLNLGAVPSEHAVRTVVLMRSQLGRPLAIQSIASDSPELECTVESLAGPQAQLDIWFRPRMPGGFRGTVRVLAQTPDTALRTVELRVTARALPVPFTLQ